MCAALTAAKSRLGWRGRALLYALPPIIAVILLGWLCVLAPGICPFMTWSGLEAAGSYGWPRFADSVANWSLVLVAIMLPSLLPMVSGYLKFLGKSDNPPPAVGRTLSFAGGYAAFLVLIGSVCALLQAYLLDTGLVSANAGGLKNPLLAGVVLIALGVFQASPWKLAALRQCRSSISFFMTTWQDGVTGAFVMGLRQGFCCLTACGALVLLLLALGPANLLLIVLLAVYLVVEKVVPRVDLLTRSTAVALVAAGAWLTVF